MDDARPWILWWILVFAANLAVPMLFASSLIAGNGALGIVAGMLCLLGVSIVVQLQLPHMVKWARRAGIVIAVSQVLPILQILAGEIGIEIATSLRLSKEMNADEIDAMAYPPMFFSAAFVATIVTGAILLIAVAVVSILLKMLFDGKSITQSHL
jgi:hypothetical protein